MGSLYPVPLSAADVRRILREELDRRDAAAVRLPWLVTLTCEGAPFGTAHFESEDLAESFRAAFRSVYQRAESGEHGWVDSEPAVRVG